MQALTTSIELTGARAWSRPVNTAGWSSAMTTLMEKTVILVASHMVKEVLRKKYVLIEILTGMWFLAKACVCVLFG
ncbi:hypothetical protein D0U02_10300 [Burkholderia pseudomallei]|nr:hypothetical protein BOC43_05520 [Burkholderia pseudomallei]RFS55567.1 hypothetical protein D0U01_31420 [Burkholderia pseudomallei]RFS64007.1 hypothetical protein D0U02_10300 [Burkholderia pseudomallei]